MDALIDQTRRLHSSLFAQELQECRSWEKFLQALPGEVPLVLEWPGVGPHVLVVHRLSEERLVFYNSLGLGGEVGASLVSGGPIRIQEEEGLESLPAQQVRLWMEEGRAVALLG